MGIFVLGFMEGSIRRKSAVSDLEEGTGEEGEGEEGIIKRRGNCGWRRGGKRVQEGFKEGLRREL